MKVGIITKPNEKGQIVIPKDIRDKLGINEQVPLNIILRGNGIYLYPVVDVIGKTDDENVYAKILEKTKGAWSTFQENKKGAISRKQIELKASQKRKHTW